MSNQLSLECYPFEALFDIVDEASGASKGAKRVDQVSYLESYLRNPEAKAKTIVVERPYVDRHWLEEHVCYYARSLYPPPPHASRLHFFSKRFSTAELKTQLANAIPNDIESLERHFQNKYLGFSVIRPLPTAPVGRTILTVYPGDPNRCYEPSRITNTVHFAGLELQLEGIPFQQQDLGVGACATTALWTALAKVMRSDGQRPPTPFEVTRAATEHRVEARAFPASAGLNLGQMASAVRAMGYEPHVFEAGQEEDIFLLALKCYLRSGIPVVARVLLRDEHEYHALTIVGLRESPSSSDAEQIEVPFGSRCLRARGITRFYVHDDRFGPYARIKYFTDKTELGESRVLQLDPTERGYEHLESKMSFHHALVPLYPKLRLTAEELIDFAVDLLPPICYVVGKDDSKCLTFDARFSLGGRYLRSALTLPVKSERLAQLATNVLLSRYVGVLSFSIRGEWFCDIVYDTTDLRRDRQRAPGPVLAVVTHNPQIADSLKDVRDTHLGPRAVIV